MHDSSEQIAEEALAGAVIELGRGAGWEAITRELAWRAVLDGDRDDRAVEQLSGSADVLLASQIDDALWAVERTVIECRDEYLEERPDDRDGALTAMRLDASEEASRLVRDAYGEVLSALLATRAATADGARPSRRPTFRRD